MTSREEMLDALFNSIDQDQNFSAESKNMLKGAYLTMSDESITNLYQLLLKKHLGDFLSKSLTQFAIEARRVVYPPFQLSQ